MLLRADGSTATAAPPDSVFTPAPADLRRYRRVCLLARSPLSPSRDPLDPTWLRWLLFGWCAVAPGVVIVRIGRVPVAQLLAALLPFGAIALA